MTKRTQFNFEITTPTVFKEQLFAWSAQFDTAVWLDSNNYEQRYSSFDACLAVEEFTAIKTDTHNAFEKLKEYQSYTKDYLFGYISYDVKNDVENLTSTNFDGLHFPDLYFFQPQKLIFIKGNTVEFHYLQMIDDEIQQDFEQIKNSNSHKITVANTSEKYPKKEKITIKSRIQKEEYLQKVSTILTHIHRGDIYEANFCQEFYAENTSINPYEIYKNLNEISTPPFATFFKHEHFYLLSATPERYLKKEGCKIISQPIKGTAKRLKNSIEDKKNAFNLANDQKERAENIMIVDLVRNDLSKTAKKGSVQVEELCKIYPFKQVHQMISTVVSEVEKNTHIIDILKDTFPMGSMTGAPKVSAMKIIEQQEKTKRGLYSGTVGYFTPDEDFDFNVIIRSILYNSDSKYVSFSVGGAITAKSVPEKEYEECLLKAKAMKYVLLHSK
ncbi:anthranilate synthase component I family protein [Tenacibaculum piscium]|uniref:anthranilate synthase component I family protein n=1 Tax=Tenacibaculum piscium TaxID=1458515 RepID=UPI00187B15AA|nr:anthranilate synthase component I family protein [Tenacibaculum piscium]MBE7684537.1 aminodeoxychorismate synthase component I [Tenacibaculum piscium]MBE7689157.1 aminodeoxychorismate synthase component I [Tenacibaculum piscium]